MADNAGMVTTMTSTPRPTSQFLVLEAADKNDWSFTKMGAVPGLDWIGDRWFFTRGRVAVIIDWRREPADNPSAATAFINPDVDVDDPTAWQPARPRMALIETLNWLASSPEEDPK